MSDASGQRRQRPEWAPAEGGEGFASEVMAGVDGGHDCLPQRAAPARSRPRIPRSARRTLSVEDYIEGITEGNRTRLAQAITLVESNAAQHQAQAQELLQALLPKTGNSIRLGITGVPGVGKSTTIETLGQHLIAQGHRVAVLAIDPSSARTRGSILGDKTRMEHLSRDERAFIRPSPSSGTLGGVARKSRETLLLCEAFGFDVVLLETVGVGQSETTVRSMVDCFLLLTLAGAGDELQGMKKGIIELADIIAVNKADGDNLRRARMAKADLNRVLSFLSPATEGWTTKALLCSALTREGLPELWERVLAFTEATQVSGVWQQRRERQTLEWFHALVEEALRARLLGQPSTRQRIAEQEAALLSGRATALQAAEAVLDAALSA